MGACEAVQVSCSQEPRSQQVGSGTCWDPWAVSHSQEAWGLALAISTGRVLLQMRLGGGGQQLQRGGGSWMWLVSCGCGRSTG